MQGDSVSFDGAMIVRLLTSDSWVTHPKIRQGLIPQPERSASSAKVGDVGKINQPSTSNQPIFSRLCLSVGAAGALPAGRPAPEGPTQSRLSSPASLHSAAMAAFPAAVLLSFSGYCECPSALGISAPSNLRTAYMVNCNGYQDCVEHCFRIDSQGRASLIPLELNIVPKSDRIFDKVKIVCRCQIDPAAWPHTH